MHMTAFIVWLLLSVVCGLLVTQASAAAAAPKLLAGVARMELASQSDGSMWDETWWARVHLLGDPEMTVSVQVPDDLAHAAFASIAANNSRVSWKVQRNASRFEAPYRLVDVDGGHSAGNLSSAAVANATARFAVDPQRDGGAANALLQSTSQTGARRTVLASPAAVGGNVSLLIVSVGFWTNSENIFYSTCDKACVYRTLWGRASSSDANPLATTPSVSALFADSSVGQFTIAAPPTSQFIQTNIDVYASTLGCAVDAYARRANANIQVQLGLNVRAYDAVVYILPPSAGGGSCGSFSVRAVSGCLRQAGAGSAQATTSLCSMFIRAGGAPAWVRGIGTLLGISGPTSVQDPTDASCQCDMQWPSRRFATVYRHLLGWLPDNATTRIPYSAGRGRALTLTSSSTTRVAFGNVGQKTLLLTSYVSEYVPANSMAPSVWISFRRVPDLSENTTSFDAYLNASLSGKIYVHRLIGTPFIGVATPVNTTLLPSLLVAKAFQVVATLAVGERYVDYDADVVFNVTAIAGDAATLVVGSCLSRAPVLALNVTQVGFRVMYEGAVMRADAMSVPDYGDVVGVTVQLRATNPSVYCRLQSYEVPLVVTPSFALPVCNLFTVRIVPDLNPLEITYDVRNSSGVVLMKFDAFNGIGGYTQSLLYCGKASSEVLTFTFRDFGGDGYCCQYGGGSYYSVSVNGIEVKRGGQFRFKEEVSVPNTAVWRFLTMDNFEKRSVSIMLPVFRPYQGDNATLERTLSTGGVTLLN
jgi:hypothetical protein